MTAKKDAPPADADERRLEAQLAAGSLRTKQFLSKHQTELAKKAERGTAQVAELEKQAAQGSKAEKAKD